MIDAQNFRALALHLGFSAAPQEVSDVLHKIYGENGEVNISVRFLELMMRAQKAHLNAIAPQVAQKNINVAILKPLRVPLPPLTEQLDFVAQVETFEQAIAAAQATIAAAPAQKQAILQKYL